MLALMATAFLAVEVSEAAIDFDTRILPILTKAGCNAGACHGAAAGRGEFRLSLYGSRPRDDYEQIVRALNGRRINHRDPGLSLLLQKPTEQQSHEGGTRLNIDGPEYRDIRLWIDQGTRRLQSRQLADFLVTADRSVVNSVGDVVRLNARATFTDGSDEDVLNLTSLTAVDPAALELLEAGRVRLKRPGRHLILARFLDRVVPLKLVLPFSTSQAAVSERASDHKIDEFIDRQLTRMNVNSAPPADSASLLRRLSLDLTGRLPAPELAATSADLNLNDAAQRRRLVDQLMSTEAFVDFWSHQMGQLFGVSAVRANPKAARAYYDWLRVRVAADEPLDQTVRLMLLAEGSVVQNPPASFHSVTADARAEAEFVSRVFLGVRLQCANCHDHPLDSWTQDDYHGFAAVFARLRRGPVIRMTSVGEVIHPVTGEAARPKIPGADYLNPHDDNRPAVAEWVTSSANPYFARAAVNRIWKHLMGRGLVEPIDDFRVTNPPSHPELLDWLTQEFVVEGFRLRPVIRTVCLSQAYARSSLPTALQPESAAYYATATSKPLAPEVFLDALSDVTGVVEPVAGEQSVSRAISLAGLTAPSTSLDLLGRCNFDDTCPDSSVAASDLSVNLHLLNGGLVNRRLSSPDGHLMKLVNAGTDAATVVNEFYLRAYARRPSPEEVRVWSSQFPADHSSEKFATTAQDFVWSLLVSDEFVNNH